MKKSRVLLAVEPCLLRQALRRVLLQHPDIEIVGELSDLVDVYIAVAKTRPDVLIHSWGASDELQAISSHLFEEHPDLLLIDICHNLDFGYAYRQIRSTQSLLSIIRATRSQMRSSGESS